MIKKIAGFVDKIVSNKCGSCEQEFTVNDSLTTCEFCLRNVHQSCSQQVETEPIIGIFFNVTVRVQKTCCDKCLKQ